MKRKYFVGDKFGKWTVTAVHPDKLTVQCECGIEKTTKTSNITSGKSQGCPKCKPVNRNFAPGNQVSKNQAFNYYKNNRNARKLGFSLTKEQFFEIADSPCYYCGEVGSNRVQIRESEEYRYNGIDRLDSNVGYQPGNVLPCCKYCNRMKSDLTFEEFTERIHRIAERWPHGSVIVPAEPIIAEAS